VHIQAGGTASSPPKLPLKGLERVLLIRGIYVVFPRFQVQPY
jgi:hypothetical protein